MTDPTKKTVQIRSVVRALIGGVPVMVPTVVTVSVSSGHGPWVLSGGPSAREVLEVVRCAMEARRFKAPGHVSVDVTREDGGGLPAGAGTHVLQAPIFLGILIATGQAQPIDHDAIVVGDLRLDGSVYPPPPGIRTYPGPVLNIWSEDWNPADPSRTEPVDFSDVRGDTAPLDALVAAAATRAPILLLGPPGCGKTMIARRLTTLLPPLDEEGKARVRSTLDRHGLLDAGQIRRPFRAPHHSVSHAGMGAEHDLASHGVLFLDDVGEFSRSALERRVDAARTTPAEYRPWFVMAANTLTDAQRVLKHALTPGEAPNLVQVDLSGLEFRRHPSAPAWWTPWPTSSALRARIQVPR